MKRFCLECDERLLGRQDKKFCSDQCRSAYHNQQNRDTRQLIRKVNKVLRRNWRILSELYNSGHTRIHRSKLEIRGFQFQYFTHEVILPDGLPYRFCYDLGYALPNSTTMQLATLEQMVLSEP